ncbi:hypothetical protein GGI20_003488 [Coemansia sp. BCRC 34301]|nr:hypothetical protein GGI20_003488 [Coemansia sp. BCRC 34301]
MPPRHYWRGRFSSGPLWNEHLSRLLSYSLDSHAVGLAKSTSAHRRFLNLISLDPPTTLDQIQQTTGPVHTYDIAVLEIGSNDAASALIDIAHGRMSVDGFAERLADTVVAQLEVLRTKGFTRILVVNLPALQHTPIVRLKGRERAAATVVKTYNRMLESRVTEWQRLARLDLFALIDLARFVDTAIGPAITKALNITDTSSFCVTSRSWLSLFDDDLSLAKFVRYFFGTDGKPACVDPSSRFYFDPIHPTDRVHRLFGYCVYQVVAGLMTGRSPFEFSEDNLIALIDRHKNCKNYLSQMSAQSSDRRQNASSSPAIDTNPEQPPVYIYDWSFSEDVANWLLTSLSTNSIDTSSSCWSSLMTPSPEYIPNDESSENIETLTGSFILE